MPRETPDSPGWDTLADPPYQPSGLVWVLTTSAAFIAGWAAAWMGVPLP